MNASTLEGGDVRTKNMTNFQENVLHFSFFVRVIVLLKDYMSLII